MTISARFRQDIDWATTRNGVIAACLIYFVGRAVFAAYAQSYDPAMTRRIEGYTHFDWLPLVLVAAQALFSCLTRSALVGLLLFAAITPIFARALSWSGPTDELVVARILFDLQILIQKIYPFVTALACAILLYRSKRRALEAT